MSGGLTDWSLSCSNEDIASADRDEERVPSKGKSLNFLLPSSTWSWGAGHDWKNKQPKFTSIWNKLRVELLLCFIEWNQMKWFGHLIRMSHWKQTMGQTQNSLGVIYRLWLGNASVFHRKSWREGCVGFSPWLVASESLPPCINN